MVERNHPHRDLDHGEEVADPSPNDGDRSPTGPRKSDANPDELESASTSPDRRIVEALTRSRNYFVVFLHHVHGKMFCLSDYAGMYDPRRSSEDQLSVDRTRIVKLARTAVEVAKAVVAVHADSWGYLVSALTPERGERLAHEAVVDMARGFIDRFAERVQRDLTERQIDVLARDLSSTSYTYDDTNRLWRGVEHEHARACVTYGARAVPLPNPDLSTQQRIESILTPLLTEPPPDSLPWGGASSGDQDDRSRQVADAPDADGSTTPGGKGEDVQLVGWQEILSALGFEAKDRRRRDLVKNLNEKSKGPIVRLGDRRVAASKRGLLRWWADQMNRSGELADAQAAAERDERVVRNDLAKPGVRKDEGYHAKDTPNKRRRR